MCLMSDVSPLPLAFLACHVGEEFPFGEACSVGQKRSNGLLELARGWQKSHSDPTDTHCAREDRVSFPA